MLRTSLLFALATLAAGNLPAQSRRSLILFEPEWRELGPANMSGRIVDLAVDPVNRAHWYVATASGGLFETTSAGTKWRALFQQENTISIGAIAIAPTDPNTIWVGTGEANSRNSVSWGDGVYVSKDAGATWQNVGLKKSRQIGCIAIHPKLADTVFVAACGSPWGQGSERGVYRTRDGGKRWKKVLGVDNKTGAIDILLDPSNPKTLFAATYERQRDAFDGGDPAKRWGPGSGIWKSTDGGDSWRRLGSGLPTTAMGRIGLAMAPSAPKILYAIIETERSGWATGSEKAPLNAKGKPHKGHGTRLGGQVGNIQHTQGQDGFQTGGVFRSGDAGETWSRVNSLTPRPFYFSQVRVDPVDPQRLYVLGIQYYVSTDGGGKFEQVRDHGIHVDFHAMRIDPEDSKHWLLAGDGGLYETFDRGANYRFFKNLPCAQFYHLSVDDREPYHVYGGLQDNGSWAVPSRTRFQDGILVGDVFKFGAGDGFRVVPHPEVEGLVYYTSQFGRLAWCNTLTGLRGGVKHPAPEKGETLRFNWDTPFALSPHDPEQLWFAGNRVIRSTERGQKSEIVSPQIGRTDRGTATALALSPKAKGLILVGTDDGALFVSRSAGAKWTNLTSSLPKQPGEIYVSSLQASSHHSSTVYLAFDGHRSDDMTAYAYVSRNAGRSWARISRGIDRGPIRVLREDAHNPDLLFAGTEFGIHVSIDRGKHWTRLRGNLPTVAVHDIAIQSREHELVIATHGRGLWSLDISGLQSCLSKTRYKAIALIQPQPVRKPRLLPRRIQVGDDTLGFPNPRTDAALYYWLKKKPSAAVAIEILDAKDRLLRRLDVPDTKGLHRVYWDLRPAGKKGRLGRAVGPGSYTVRLSTGKTTLTRKLVVRAN
jgi:photosystem II stability/assembly factor-like uncharacterized protein